MEAGDSNFRTLSKIDVSEKVKDKNGLKYLPWSSAWAEVKKVYPDAEEYVIPQVMDEFGNTRFWHDDGRSGWVEVEVVINGKTEKEVLAIMDYKNKPIPADQITSVDANKAEKRCLTKAISKHGLALYLYEGEDLPEECSKALKLQEECMELIKKKYELGGDAKTKTKEVCVEAERKAFPLADDADIVGNPRNIEDVDILAELKKKLLAIRK